MSLIETAIKKIQASANAQTQAAPVGAAPAQRRAAPKFEPVDPTKIRQFRRVSPNAEVMERNCVLPQVTDQAALRGYKILRTRIGQRLAANNWRSIAVTGTESGQGKTLTALNLAIALAQDPNTYVFLVDLDLQRPQIASYFGIPVERGLGDYLVGEAEIGDIIYNPSIERLAVVPNTRMLEHSSDFLASPRMVELEASLNAESPKRIIIYDMPPLLLSDDVLTFVPRVDGVLMVISEGHTTRASLERSKELLSEMNLLGVVLNRSSEHNDSPYY